MLLLLSGLAFAAGPDTDAVFPDKASLWDAYLAHFEPVPGDPGDPATAAAEHGPACATGVVAALTQHWDWFTPAEKAEITAHVAPFKRELTDPMPQPYLGHGDPDVPVLTAGSDTCWGAQATNRLMSDHFVVEYDDGVIDATTAQAFSDALEWGWSKEIDELGWNAPDGTSSYKILALITSDNYAGAYTTVAQCGSVYMPYIVAGKGSFYGNSNWYQDEAVHEFNHASQFSYGYGYEFWFWEATATYMQDQVWPLHEWWSTYVTGYADEPYLAMNASDQQDQDIFWHMYGMCIWLFYLDEDVGGTDLARQMWDYSSTWYTRNGYDLGQEQALGDLGYDWPTVYQGFMAANTVMDYRQHDYYPAIDITKSVSSLPSSGASRSATQPYSYGQNYIEIDPSLATPDLPDLQVDFDGEGKGKWVALIVGTKGTNVKTVVPIELTTEVGSGKLEDFGQYDDVFLVVSPTKDATTSFPYQWTMEAVAPPAPPEDTGDTDTTGDTDNTPSDDGNGKVSLAGACGCDEAAGTMGVLPMVMGAMFAMRRRRV